MTIQFMVGKQSSMWEPEYLIHHIVNENFQSGKKQLT